MRRISKMSCWRGRSRVWIGATTSTSAHSTRTSTLSRAIFTISAGAGSTSSPSRHNLRCLPAARPRDINLNVALGCTNGALTFHDFSPLGVSTLDPVVAGEMRARGFIGRDVQVPVLTLAQVCRDHDVRAIDFLKIDVEGHEAEVLAGHDWNFVRPRILLVEATRPMSTTPAFDAWEPMILRQGYLFAWFDGLNRYYVRREDADLLAHFRIPPNIFDGYVVARGTHQGSCLPRWRPASSANCCADDHCFCPASADPVHRMHADRSLRSWYGYSTRGSQCGAACHSDWARAWTGSCPIAFTNGTFLRHV